MFLKKTTPDYKTILLAQCEEAEKAIKLLDSYMRNSDTGTASEIDAAEDSGDQLQKALNEYVENSFITPVSRHLLFNLARVLDDLTDSILDLKDYLSFFGCRPGEKDFEMKNLDAQAISHLTEAVRQWDAADQTLFWENIHRAQKLEHQVKRIYWENIREILQRESVQEIIVSREFCRDLSVLSERIGKAADRLADLKIKSIK